jgi:polyisoprenoid-binding protein YceI
MQKYILIFIFLFGSQINANANIFSQKVETFEQAKKHSNFIKFIGKSTKFGLVTTEFDGYTKEFTINYDKKNQQIENIKVEVIASSIDTDSDGRNEKMYQQCLETEKFKTIMVSLKSAIDLNQTQQTMSATLRVRDQETPIELKLDLKKIDNKIILAGQSQFLLSSLAVADPSIAIAKVHDQFQLSFQIELNP